MNTANDYIQMYLGELKVSLRGLDKATVQDALADAEEHLRTALDDAHEDAEEID